MFGSDLRLALPRPLACWHRRPIRETPMSTRSTWTERSPTGATNSRPTTGGTSPWSTMASSKTRARRLLLADVADPGLGAHLDGFPGAAEGRGVGQVEVADAVDGHAAEDGGGGNVDALSDLGVFVPEQLHAEQPPGGAVAGDAHGDAVAAGVVGLVVMAVGWRGAGVVPGCGGFGVAQPGTGGGLVEAFDDLGAEAAGEPPVPAEGVLPGDPPLFVGGRAQRQVGFAEQAVVGDHAVPGGEHIPHVRPHLPVPRDRGLRP